MIQNKLLPSVYLVELSGDSTQTVISGNFGIKKITIASKTFSNDLEAFSKLRQTISNLKIENVEEFYNPEFFPSLEELKLSDDQLARKEAIDQHIEYLRATEGPEKSHMAVTNFFDINGDFTIYRAESIGSNAKIIARVAVEPEVYLKEKNEGEAVAHTPFIDYRDRKELRIH